jgi:hypothetical protein
VVLPGEVLELRSGTGPRGAGSAPLPGQNVTCNAPAHEDPLESVGGGMAHLLSEARARLAGARPPVAGGVLRTAIAPHLQR